MNFLKSYFRKSWLWRIALASLLIGAVALAFWLLTSMPFKPFPAPRFAYTDLNGKKITSDSLHGRVQIVNFWSTSCAICIQEMPQMAATYRQFRDRGLGFVAVAMSYDAPNYVLDFARTRQLPFPVALDIQSAMSHAFGDVSATPTTFVIDKNGTVIQRYVGAPDFQQLHKLLERALDA